MPVQDTARQNRGACARPDPANLLKLGRGGGAGGGVARSYSHVIVGAAATVTGETGAIHQRPVITKIAKGVSRAEKTLLGQHLWARGYFCATVGAVDEDAIKHYIENQRWDEDDHGFKITAPTEP